MNKKIVIASVGTAAAFWSDHQGQISVALAADAYCSRDTYMSHNFGGAAVGFVSTHVIYSGP